jgi:Sec-independent protein translocase protein TatA
MHPGEVMNEIDDHEIEKRDVSTEQQHRDDDDKSGISQLLETADAFILRFPGPRRFPQLGKNFAEKVSRFRDHGNVSKNQVRRDSNPQPTVLETATLPIELLT